MLRSRLLPEQVAIVDGEGKETAWCRERLADGNKKRAMRGFQFHAFGITTCSAWRIGQNESRIAFREQLRRTVNEELIRLRISKLKRLLVESEESVKELSSKVGFGTTANMFPIFKRHTGMTPKEYREKHGAERGA